MNTDWDESDPDLSFGYPVFNGIPWKKYSELEIQMILKIHFERQGYSVIWRHLDGPANEDGIDLECIRESDGNRIVVAVKKHPRKEALSQLVQLRHQNADRRIYVYVGGAVQSFRDELGEFSKEIEFWDEKLIEKELNRKGFTLSIMVDNTPANNAIAEIMRFRLEVMKDDAGIRKHVLTSVSDALKTLWDLKDRAVTAYKSLLMSQLLFEQNSNFHGLSEAQVQGIVILILDYAYKNGLAPLSRAFLNLPPEIVLLLKQVHSSTHLHSNWLHLLNMSIGLIPGHVGREYRKYESEKEKWKELEAELELEIDTAVDEFNILDHAASIFRAYQSWTWGLETVLDDVYNEIITKYLD